MSFTSSRRQSEVVKLTKQGVRDLGGQRPPRPRVVFTCPHVWEREIDWDCAAYDMEPRQVAVMRCGMCKDIRR